jgi:predicted transcriptional regulator
MAIINIVVDPELKAAVDAQAAAEQRTLKAVVVRALEAYLAEQKDRAA